jgi:hypothetical protein
MNLGHSDIPFALVVGEWDNHIIHKAHDIVFKINEAFKQVSSFALLRFNRPRCPGGLSSSFGPGHSIFALSRISLYCRHRSAEALSSNTPPASSC